MSPSRRTLSFVFIFLSAQNVLCQLSQGKIPISVETRTGVSSTNEPPSITVGTGPDLISVAQRLLTGSRQPFRNDFNTQNVITETSVGPSFQQAPIDINPLLTPVPTVQSSTNSVTSSAVASAQVLSTEKLQSVPTFSSSPTFLPQVDCSGAINQNFASVVPTSFNQPSQTISLSDAIRTNNCVSPSSAYAELSQFYQQPITIQPPCVPSLTSFMNLVNSAPCASQTVPEGIYGDPIPAFYLGVVDTPQIIQEPTPIKSVPDSGLNVVESVPGIEPVPLSLQINMPSFVPEQQPIIVVSTPNPPLTGPDTLFPPPSFPPCPVIVMERSKSRWSSLLPILLIALCDCGCGNGGGNCGSCGSTIPVPYPIPIPTNNPIILGKGSSKSSSSDA